MAYLIEEYKLPLALTVKGKVELNNCYDKNGVKPQIEIYVGGYETVVNSDGTYQLSFSANELANIPLTVHYTHDGEEINKVVFISYKRNVYVQNIDIILE